MCGKSRRVSVICPMSVIFISEWNLKVHSDFGFEQGKKYENNLKWFCVQCTQSIMIYYRAFEENALENCSKNHAIFVQFADFFSLKHLIGLVFSGFFSSKLQKNPNNAMNSRRFSPIVPNMRACAY